LPIANGRFFTADEDKPGAAPLAVLSYATWQRRSGGSADVFRRTMRLDGQAFTVIGVLALVPRKGTWLAGGGALVGIPAGLAISRAMRSLLYGISSRDLTASAGVAVLLILAALAANYIPARRAAKVDPTVALRYG